MKEETLQDPPATQKANTTPDGQAPQKRDRKTALEIKDQHYNEVLDSLSFEDKVELIKELKAEVATELANRQKLATQAAELTNGL